MATKAKRPKTATRPKAKSKLQSKAKAKTRSVLLTAGTAAVRKSKSAVHKPGHAPVAVSPLNLALAMFGFMQRVTSTYAEFPARLVQCRSLMDVWREQARLTQRILSVTQKEQ